MTVRISTDIVNQLNELSCDNILQQIFLELFWAHLCTSNYAELTDKAILILYLHDLSM